ncbi:hypothetical protein L1286_05955 [Pseudoalteromonas sp. SMS1]|uniref:hypothetical protein n=1 Tax=Pseudoalteromonas sp. SMS1 TaxID=2908894 RepID=UPI001F21CA07|nr:hypothetical protein [Pseudoalteromonas sp. SMS1]MCF2857002.1 hypothetical protein [Pseudoalteromonas sp. SMS1]
MKYSILIITSSYDKTVDYLQEKFSELSFFRFNVDQFSNYRVCAAEGGFSISDEYKSITNISCASIYYRKPSIEDLKDKISEEYLYFVFKEVFALVDGIVDTFDGYCLTRPRVFRYASNKVVQSSIAKKVGFNMAKHEITNNSGSDFMSKPNRVVKPIAVGRIKRDEHFEFVQTNMVDEKYTVDLLKYCPSYFQAYVEKDYECRLTIVGDDFFPVKIDSENKIDWRVSNNKISYSLMDVPKEVLEKCYEMMNIMEVEFGCFDFIIKNDEWFFLEVNINGQWAWLEFELGLNISRSIISKLEVYKCS